MSYVTEVPAASPEETALHFLRRLSVETDCADVHHAITHGEQDFVLLHVVGNPQTFARRHLPGALHLTHSEMTVERMAQWPADTLFVVYCAGPHCNGADRAALKLARMGLAVKIMIGGITGWEDEGYTFASGTGAL
ncbi:MULTISPECIES: rhodanese-like domain-containing protein [Kosakonia]|uniref:rhodanese-like domain-containing protein n=1 Tax=Kosakonia TaxID=1330547 RepID=UPI00201E001A|nr:MULTISPECIES: rhodanese-like domain-containing protein [Kosakonia]MCL6745838.1 rhodanese-like domain-containing protein [Kosakonia sp. R1.Fl]MDZ7321063.1 rhodanese-like domain-containing protein [Kosakonia sacchari]